MNEPRIVSRLVTADILDEKANPHDPKQPNLNERTLTEVDVKFHMVERGAEPYLPETERRRGQEEANLLGMP